MSRSRVIGRRGVVGVQGGEDDVPGQRRLDRISAVSRSRISPTRILSGSCRRIARRQAAKVTPISGLIGTWIRPSISYSTGSSVVMILSSIVFSSLSVA